VNLLTIGGVPISVGSSDSIAQTYAPIGGVARLRTMAGGLIAQRNWRRLKTTISVSEARFLPALNALDLDHAHVIQCLAPRHIAGASNAVALPTARRADVAPYGFAVLPTGFEVRTPGVLTANTLTLTPVTGAIRYTACYVPELTVLITDLSEHYDVRKAVAGWELTAEEI
jgi:hypothetical protein